MPIKLGSTAKDRFSGFQGVVTAITKRLHMGSSCFVESINKTGIPQDPRGHWFVEQGLELVEVVDDSNYTTMDLDDFIAMERLEKGILGEVEWPIEDVEKFAQETCPDAVAAEWWKSTVQEVIDTLLAKGKLVSLYEGIDVYGVPGRHAVNKDGEIYEIEEGSEAQPAGGDQESPDGATQNVAQGDLSDEALAKSENPGDQSE